MTSTSSIATLSLQQDIILYNEQLHTKDIQNNPDDDNNRRETPVGETTEDKDEKNNDNANKENDNINDQIYDEIIKDQLFGKHWKKDKVRYFYWYTACTFIMYLKIKVRVLFIFISYLDGIVERWCLL